MSTLNLKNRLENTWIIVLSVSLIGFSSCTYSSDSREDVRSEILSKGRIVVWALNEGNADTLMNDFWQSDSALFLINGRKIQGYQQIKQRLEESMKYRKKLELKVLAEDVLILSPTSATHVVEFTQTVTGLDDSKSNAKGNWTAVYKKINDQWKAVFVHESYYSTDNSK